jgi:hypothetical protein
MGAALVIADVLAQDALGMALAEDQDVIEAVATECPHEALANRVCQWRSGRRQKTPHPEAAEPHAKARVVDAVAVVQQIRGGASPTASIMRCATHALMATFLIRLLRSAPVVMVQAAEHGNSLDTTMHLRQASDGLLLSEGLMRARLVVKAGEFDDKMSQVLLTKDKDVIEKLAS